MGFKEACRKLWPVAAGVSALVAWRACVLASFGPVAPNSPPLPPPGVHVARGAIHVHTDFSHDGRATLSEIADAALTCGLDYVWLTDHNSFGYATKGQEGWMSGVLMLSGTEAGTLEGHDATGKGFGSHMLVLGRGPFPEPLGAKPAEELAGVARRHQSLSFAAHPGSTKTPWRGSYKGLTGIEIVNLFSGLLATPWWKKTAALAAYPLNPLWAMGTLSEPRVDARHFDAVARRQRVTAIGGADAHASLELTKGWKVDFPPMKHFFRLMTTHVLLEKPLAHDTQADRRALLAGLAAGRSYVCFDYLAAGEGFSYTAHAQDQVHQMGATLQAGPITTLRARTPDVPGARLRLLCDGEIVATAAGPELTYRPTREGAYRCEAWLELRSPFFGLKTSRPWIYSSPIYIGAAYGQS